METNKNEIEYCKCENAGIINDGDGIDINCHYCKKEVEGMRKNFERMFNAKDYIEWEKGRFARKNDFNKPNK